MTLIGKILRQKIVVIFLILFSLMSIDSFSQDKNFKAYSLFVYNFMKYMEWPEKDNQGDFVIGTIGDSPIEMELNQLAKTKKIRGRNIVIKKYRGLEDVGTCHLLYVASSKTSLIKEIDKKLSGKSTLVVGEREGAAYKGAGISFAIAEDDAISFDINKKAIESHALKISSSLIKLGDVID